MVPLLQIIFAWLALTQAREVDVSGKSQLQNTCESPDIEFISLNLPYQGQSYRYIDQICDVQVCGVNRHDHGTCAVRDIPILISLVQSEDVELYNAEAVRTAYLAQPEDPNLHAYDGLDILVVDPTSEYLLDFLLEVRRIHPGAYLSLSIDYRMDIAVLDDLKRDASINRTNLIMPQDADEGYGTDEGAAEPQIELGDPIQNQTGDWDGTFKFLEFTLHLAVGGLILKHRNFDLRRWVPRVIYR